MNSAHLVSPSIQDRFVVFVGTEAVARGNLPDVALKTKDLVDSESSLTPIVFDATTGAQIDLDLRGSRETVLERARGRDPLTVSNTSPSSPPARSPGRPKLGVVAREVTLLPRHWEWLASQSGGASVALRKLVEQATRTHRTADRRRAAQNQCYRFISAVGGNLAGFESASRALFAGDGGGFAALMSAWPNDVAELAAALAKDAFIAEGHNGDPINT
jgi:uncharacterized protein